MLYSFFCHQKAIKNRKALHEIIRVSSLSITFVEYSFKPVYLTIVVLASQNIGLDIFIRMLPPHPTPIPSIAPAVRTLLQVLSSPLR